MKHSFAVIDSYSVGQETPPALKKLQELGAERLSFVALTHPHADHYIGLSEIVDFYQNKIDNFYSFPIGIYNDETRLKKFALIYKEIFKNSDDDKVKRDTKALVKLLVSVKKHIGLDNWEELTGHNSPLYPVGFEDVEICSLLPPPKVKGDFFNKIDQGTYQPQTDKENDLSFALSVKYKGYEIILGGDGTRENWEYHKIHLGRKSETLNGHVVKLPHHGSKRDCTPGVISYLFGNNEEKHACISASGGKHPHPSVLKELQAQGIKPYCTNLSRVCGASKELLEEGHFGIDPVFIRYLDIMSSERSSHSIKPCQGTITISIDIHNHLTIHREYNTLCPLRNEYDFL